jgi:hypothetical protein
MAGSWHQQKEAKALHFSMPYEWCNPALLQSSRDGEIVGDMEGKTMTLEQRQEMEAQVMKSAISELISHGFVLSVFDGEELTVTKSTDEAAIFAALRTTDEDVLYADRPNGDGRETCRRFVQFVYGNDGWDVIADNSSSLEDYLDKTTALQDTLADQAA